MPLQGKRRKSLTNSQKTKGEERKVTGGQKKTAKGRGEEQKGNEMKGKRKRGASTPTVGTKKPFVVGKKKTSPSQPLHRIMPPKRELV